MDITILKQKLEIFNDHIKNKEKQYGNYVYLDKFKNISKVFDLAINTYYNAAIFNNLTLKNKLEFYYNLDNEKLDNI